MPARSRGAIPDERGNRLGRGAPREPVADRQTGAEIPGFEFLRRDQPKLGEFLVEANLAASDAGLFEALRRWRGATAREQGVPAYVILHDKTLRELASVRPGTHGQLAGISGMGSAKIERYGEELMALIRTAD